MAKKAPARPAKPKAAKKSARPTFSDWESPRGEFRQAVVCLGNAEILGALVPDPRDRRIGFKP